MKQTANTNEGPKQDYVPALGFAWATRLYDSAIRISMREGLLRKRTVACVKQANPSEVLEAGCGTGSLTRALARGLPNANITGVDIDPQALKIAQEKLDDADIVKLIAANLLNLVDVKELSEKRFDHVVSSLVLHHLTTGQKHIVLKNLWALLNKDGKLTIVDWGPPVGIVQYLGFWLVRLLDGLEFTGANREGRLPSLLSGAGFTVENVKPLHQTALGTVWLYQARRSPEGSTNQNITLGDI
ncbi:class I SAM-dependent methyltransferase [Kordiimonas aquimaris]|uniref:class I SAM-dependent methyltransferase n=1 Tax=Kordiimonas aquimaris TaxID=707591 RepID=UPI0021D225D5|nr:class I SAM-dependent methyltransferase [Kordiimonas aquimaris]